MASKTAAKTSQMDRFANKFYATVTESAANTLTFSEIQSNISAFEKYAWIIHRLEWYIPKTTWDLIVNTADMIDAALTASNNLTALGLDQAAVIDRTSLGTREATAVGFETWRQPLIRDFTGLPGGGLIVSPRPLYIAAVGTSLTAVGTIQCRGYFTMMSMQAEEYLDLIDFYRIIQ